MCYLNGYDMMFGKVLDCLDIGRGADKMPRFRNMRERVEYAYDVLNVDIFYEGNFIYTLFDNDCSVYMEYLTEEEMDAELNRIWMNKNTVDANREY